MTCEQLGRKKGVCVGHYTVCEQKIELPELCKVYLMKGEEFFLWFHVMVYVKTNPTKNCFSILIPLAVFIHQFDYLKQNIYNKIK